MRRRVHVLTVAVAALLAGCASTDDGGDGATRAMVLATCAPDADPVEAAVCECAFEELRDRFDAEELERLDRQLRDDPEEVPAEVQEVVLACGFEPVAPPTTKPKATTTTVSPEGSTTTAPQGETTTTRRSP